MAITVRNVCKVLLLTGGLLLVPATYAKNTGVCFASALLCQQALKSAVNCKGEPKDGSRGYCRALTFGECAYVVNKGTGGKYCY